VFRTDDERGIYKPKKYYNTTLLRCAIYYKSINTAKNLDENCVEFKFF
jgi:hypothetical protein